MNRRAARQLLLLTLTLITASGCPGPRTPTGTSDAATPTLRLPGHVVPSRYEVRLRLVPGVEAYSGAVTVDLTVRRATAVVWLHAGRDLAVQAASIAVRGQTWPARVRRAGEDFLGLELTRALPKGRHRLRLEFTGRIPVGEERGLYRQDDGGVPYLFTQFESTHARKAFPCFDEPGLKVPWQLTLEVPAALVAVANTPVRAEGPSAGGMRAVTFAETPPLPSYLVAFAVGPFEIVDLGRVGRKGTPVRLVVPRGRTAETRYAAQTTPEALRALEDYFGSAHPYEKLDHLAVPMKPGAMENPGLITFGAQIMLAHPEDEGLDFQRGYLGIAVHELSHLWFGDLVTMAWWDDLWLNESFATWMTLRILERLRPAWHLSSRREQTRAAAMRADSLASARRMRQPITSAHDIANAFDSITYQKGAMVLHMFEQFIGPEAFRKGVQGYLARHLHGTAAAADFFRAMAESTGRADVFAGAMQTFVDQAGVPLVSVALRCDAAHAARVSLRQEPYRPLGSPAGPEQRWQVPVCVRYGGSLGEGRACTLLRGGTGELDLPASAGCPTWLHPNDEQRGYYRVGYPDELLRRLRAVGFRPLRSVEREGLLADLQALARAGRMALGDVLALIPELIRTPDPQVLSRAAGLVSGLTHSLVEGALRPGYRRLVEQWFGKEARALGWSSRPGEPAETRLLRGALAELVALESGDATLVGEASRMTSRWLTERQGVPPDVLGLVLRTAVRWGGPDVTVRVRAALARTRDHRLRVMLFAALGSIADAGRLDEALRFSLSPGFDLRESLMVVAWAAGYEENRDRVWSFLLRSYDAILARLPEEWRAYTVGFGSMFCDEPRLAEVERFFRDRAPRIKGGPRNLAQSLERIRQCIANRKAQQPGVSAFLRSY